MDKISSVKAGLVHDSHGDFTVEAAVSVGKQTGKASVPSGVSTGMHEAVALDAAKAADNINKIIAQAVVGKRLCQQELDDLMAGLDGTKNKSRLGANATLAVSLAFARASALAEKKPLYAYISGLTGKKMRMPAPFLNILEGGRHASTDLALQEFMIVPEEKTFIESMAAAKETYNALKSVIKRKFRKTRFGDEGGFSPDISTAEEALDLLEEAVSCSGRRIVFAVDAAASAFYKKGKYAVKKGSKTLSAGELADYYMGLIRHYKIISLEDPFEQEHFNDFARLTKMAKVQIVGDDLLATNIARIRKAAKLKSCNCLLLKPNQAGTLSEAVAAAKTALKSSWRVMVSHRGHETMDSFLADLAVGGGYGQIKAGAPFQKERAAKYSRLLKIERELKK